MSSRRKAQRRNDPNGVGDETMLTEDAVEDWIDEEIARRVREEDTLPADVPLTHPDAFSDSYNDPGTAVPEDERGRRSKTIRALLARCCSGWPEPPSSEEFFAAMIAKPGSARQRSIVSVLPTEGRHQDRILAFREGAFTWRQLATAMHHTGPYGPACNRLVNQYAAIPMCKGRYTWSA